MLKTAFEQSFFYKLARPFIDSYRQSGTKRLMQRLGHYWRQSALGKWFYRFTYEKESTMERSRYRRLLDGIGNLANKIAAPIHRLFEKPAKNSGYFSGIHAIATAPAQDALRAVSAFLAVFFCGVMLLSFVTGTGRSAMALWIILTAVSVFSYAFCGPLAAALKNSFFVKILMDLVK